MDTNLARLVLIAAAANLAATGAMLHYRPELQHRSEIEDVYHMAIALERNGVHDQAIDLLRKVASEGRQTAFAASASYEVAKIYMRKKFDMYEARRALEEATSFSGSEAAAAAQKDLEFLNEHWGADGSPVRLWFEASEAYHAGYHQEALKRLESLCSESGPQTTLRPQALLQKVRVLLRIGDRGAAGKAISALIAAYPDSYEADRARVLQRSLN